MELVIRFEANELVKNEAHTYYNHIHWDVKPNNLKISRLIEVYDDVSEHPSYEMFRLKDSELQLIAYGEGDPVPKDRIGYGGVFFEVTIFGQNLTITE